jgi:hypothetical protein
MVFANEKVKRPPGRPRTGMKPTVAVRLSPDLLAHVDQMAADTGKKRSDVIRDIVGEAFAGRAIGAAKLGLKPPRSRPAKGGSKREG